MTLKLHDTMTREKRGFQPQDSKRITVYVCGPTPYNFAHIGNARPPVVFDVLRRLLMKTYGATYWQSLIKLGLPAAMPFIFNGLKICTTLALIGAIVAEFFGSPIRGMGFRISTEVGRLSLDMVWAEITVAALAGSAFYGTMALIEKAVTFWHPSQRH